MPMCLNMFLATTHDTNRLYTTGQKLDSILAMTALLRPDFK